MWGGELVLRDGEAVGQVTSAAWGETLGSCVALAYVWRRDGEAVTTDYLTGGQLRGQRRRHRGAGDLHTRPPFDPANIRIRS